MVYPAMALLVTGALALTASCNKKDSTPTEVCKVQRVVSGNESYLFSYDDQFRVSKIERPGSIANYSYNGNQSTILTTSSGSFSSKKIITTNDAGLVLNVKTENNTSGSLWSNVAYTYNGNQVETSVSSNSTGIGGSTTNYVWASDGNLATIISGSGATTDFTYYTDQAFQEGDFLNVIHLVQEGYTFYKSKNLVKSASSNAISYEMDAENKIKKIMANNSVVQVEYTCR